MYLGDGAWQVRTQGSKPLTIKAPAISLRPLPPFSRWGVSFAFLQGVEKELGPSLEGKTTAEANELVFKPLMAGARSSMCDALVRLGAADDAGRPYAAPATVFLSHAWRYPFSQLLEAVGAFVAAQPEPEQVYVWLDVLTVNQHAGGEALPQAWWATAFKQGICAIEHTCLVLAPWRTPIPR